MEIATIGFTQHTAESFFGRLRAAHIQQLIDVRINNVSQLAGFAKRDDLRFFLRELCDATYVHETLLAPTEELLKEYRDKKVAWPEYEKRFLGLMEQRSIESQVPRELFSKHSALLCSEHTPEKCHRRLVAEYLGQHWGNVDVIHL